jgi:small multidrug resistance pump
MSNFVAYSALAGAIIFEVIGTSLLKASAQFTKLLPTLGTLAAYTFAFYFLSLTLRTLPVGIAYALWSGMGMVLISGVGWFIYHQKLDFFALLGMGLILLGVLIINVFSKSMGH